MPLKLQEGIDKIQETIRHNVYHRDYKRVVDLAKEYTAYATGEDIDELLIQYTPREDTTLFDQRKRVTQEVTPDIVSRCAGPMYKAARTTPTITLNWKDSEKAEANKTNLSEAILNFYGDESVDSYMSQRFAELNVIDPNSFIVVEFSETVDSKDVKSVAKPYPYEVNSEEAVRYFYKNNILEYLIVLTQNNDLKRYTIYLENENIVYQQVNAKDVPAIIASNPNIELFKKDPSKKDEETEVYIVSLNEHKSGKILARRVGVKKDLKTRGRTCVSFIHAARPYLKKSMKAISEFDLATCLHLFPQKIQYDEVCPGDISENKICKEGKDLEGKICTVCHGTGYKTHTSSADIIRVRMPKDPKDMVSLENYMAYKGPSMELLEFMKKYGLYELSQLAINAVYSSELLTPKTTTATATEINVDLDSVYDALKIYTDGYSAMNKHIVTCIAKIRDVGGENFIYEHKFPKDFKMKSITMLLDDLQKANTSGASSYVKREINRDLINKMYIDKPDEAVKIDVKDWFNPFSGKSENEINAIITNDLTSRYNKILYANFEQIFSELENEQNTDVVNFYKMDRTKQIALVKEKVNSIMKGIDDEAAAKNAGSIGSFNPDGGNGDAVSQTYNVGDDAKFGSESVEIIDANPGPEGGIYTIRFQNGTEQEVKGNQLSK